MEDRRHLTPDSRNLIPAKGYLLSAFHHLTKDGLALMVFYDYLLSDEGYLMKDGGYLMEDDDYLTFWKDNPKEDFLCRMGKIVTEVVNHLIRQPTDTSPPPQEEKILFPLKLLKYRIAHQPRKISPPPRRRGPRLQR